ncbi:MAG: hypothetical protein UZ21_OP11001001073 [Microgenomates bacterium OLB22]|nr:MAG: hypothetical protein UZ21_OP11001001073 [Microgenomates bacterium OLB22]
MKIVVPMAGRGSRFAAVSHQNPEYKKPKPLIDVKGLPMVAWALKSFPFVDLPFRKAKTKIKVSPGDLIFICLKEHKKEFNISTVLKNTFGDAISVLSIPEVTRGAAETARKAKRLVDRDEDLIITDSDHFFDGRSLYKQILRIGKQVSGIIPVFTEHNYDPKWSYTLTDKRNIALDVNEKDVNLARQGAYANIGGYYFAKSSYFFDEADGMIRDNDVYGDEGKKEFYVAPIYRRLIQKGHKIGVAVSPKVWGLGTPGDYEHFLAHYPA